jgi:Aldehyde dehydrogenase family
MHCREHSVPIVQVCTDDVEQFNLHVSWVTQRAGNFIGPTVIADVTPLHKCYQQELFGPILVVLEVESLPAALELVNSHRYGNGCAIFTSSGSAARAFEAQVDVGMVGINVPIPVPLPWFSFTGCACPPPHRPLSPSLARDCLEFKFPNQTCGVRLPLPLVTLLRNRFCCQGPSAA